MVTGAEAAEMYTTHGFPPELFETLAAEHNLGFDWAGFNARWSSTASSRAAASAWSCSSQPARRAEEDAAAAPSSSATKRPPPKPRWSASLPAMSWWSRSTKSATSKPIASCSTRRRSTANRAGRWATPARSSATDSLRSDRHAEGRRVSRCTWATCAQARLELGAKVTATVDAERRQGIRRAHSATHILHYALQKHLGKHAQQQGSKVDGDWLRFDFTNPAAVDARGARSDRRRSQRAGRRGAKISWRSLPIAEARETGAMMLFGEKYPDIVRMVSMGEFSKELCGGTHLDNSGQVGLFKIVGEESVAAGTRRITALTGAAALDARARSTKRRLHETAAAAREFRRPKCRTASRRWRRNCAT